MKKVIILIVLLVSAFVCMSQPCTKMDTTNPSVLNLKNLYKEILKDSIKFPEIVLRQAVAETGWLTSKACIKRNNLFGFNNGVTKFKTWQEAVLAYKIWQDKYYKSGPYEKFLIKVRYASNGHTYIKFIYSLKIPECIY